MVDRPSELLTGITDPDQSVLPKQPDLQEPEIGLRPYGGGAPHYDLDPKQAETEAAGLTELRGAMRDFLLQGFTRQDLERLFLYHPKPEVKAIREDIAKSDGLAGAVDTTIDRSLSMGVDLAEEVIKAAAADNPRRYQQFEQRLKNGLAEARKVELQKKEDQFPVKKDDEQYGLAKAVHGFLKEGFVDDDLRRLLRYSLNPRIAALLDETTIDVGKRINLDRIIGLAHERGLFPAIIQEAKQINPRQYANFATKIETELTRLGEMPEKQDTKVTPLATKPPSRPSIQAQSGRPPYIRTYQTPPAAPPRQRPSSLVDTEARERARTDAEIEKAAQLIEAMQKRPEAEESRPAVVFVNNWDNWDNPPYGELRRFLETNFVQTGSPDSDVRQFIRLLIESEDFHELKNQIGVNSNMSDVVDKVFERAEKRVLWDSLMNIIARVKPEELKEAQETFRIRVDTSKIEPLAQPEQGKGVPQREPSQITEETTPTEVVLVNNWDNWDNPPYGELRRFLETNFVQTGSPDSDVRRFIRLLTESEDFGELKNRIGVNSDMGDVVDKVFERAEKRVLWDSLMNIIARVKPEELKEAQDKLRIKVKESE